MMNYIVLLLAFVSVLKFTTQQQLTFYDYDHCKLDSHEVVDAWEKWPTVDVTLCDRNVPYNDAAIESALNGDKNLLQLYKTVIRDMFPLPYEEKLFFKNINGPDIACEDVCPGIYKNATAILVRLPYELNGVKGSKIYACNIIRPWEQIVPYMQCKYDTPRHITTTADASYYCVPNSFVEREVVIYCADAKPQCKHARLKVPLGCAVASIKCRGNEIVQRRQDIAIGDTSETDAIFANFLDMLGK